MIKTYAQQTTLFAIALLATIGVSYAGATFGWTGPTAAPAASNTPAPISTGSSTQTKNGSLILNAGIYGTAPNQWQNATGLTVFGSTLLYGLTLVDGNQASGKVLTSDANGNASWTATNGLKVDGTLAGGCYASSANPSTPPNTMTAWGSSSINTDGSCMCPTGYNLQVIGQYWNGTAVLPTGYICYKNN